MLGKAEDWNSPVIPLSIRRPWCVFEEDIGDKFDEAAEEGTQVAPHVRERLAAIQARGAHAAFLELSEDTQRMYADCSLKEVGAYTNWQRAEASRRESAGEPAIEYEGAWDALTTDDKCVWVPEDPRLALVGDEKWAALLADGAPACGANEPGTAAIPTPTRPKVEPTPGGVKAESNAAPLKLEPKDAPCAAVAALSDPEVAPSAVVAKPLAQAQPSAVAAEPPKQATDTSAALRQRLAAAGVAVVPEASGKSSASVPPQPTSAQAAAGVAPVAPAAAAVAKALVEVAKRGSGDSRVGEVAEASKASAAVQAEKRGSSEPSTSGRPTRACRNPHKEQSTPSQAPVAVARKRTPTLASRASSRFNGTQADNRQEHGSIDARTAIPATPNSMSSIPAAPQRDGGIAQPMKFTGPLAPEGMCRDALDVSCVICKSEEATDENDIGMCDRCNRGFHAKCHDPVVKFFGRPEDQWFCAPCTVELCRLRGITLVEGDFCWASAPANSPPWPARIFKIDFVSLTDPVPLWVHFFDSHKNEGAWVSETQVRSWTQGPNKLDVVRRSAVKQAEKHGAQPLSGDAPQSAIPMTPLSQAIAQADAGYTPSSANAKRSQPLVQSHTPAAKRGRPRRVIEEPDDDGDDDEEDAAMQQKVEEMRKFITEARERQSKLEQRLEEAASQSQRT